jgi:hypothetical protein
MVARSVYISLAVIIALIGVVWWSSSRSGPKFLRYGSFSFSGGSGECDEMEIYSAPFPKNVEIKLPGGERIGAAQATRDHLASIYGDGSVFQHSRKGRMEQIGDHDFIIVFANGEFDSLFAMKGLTILNLDNGKSFTLPAKESKIREVFGKPTKVEYRHSSQP